MALAKNYMKQAAGRKVYSNGSYAPNHGAVDKSGYFRREIRNQAKKKAAAKGVMSPVANHPWISRLQNQGLDRKQIVKKVSHGNGAASLGVDKLKALGFAHPYFVANMDEHNKKKPVHNGPRNNYGVDPGKTSKDYGRPIAGGKRPKQNQKSPDNGPGLTDQPQSMQVNPNGQLDLPYSPDMAWQVYSAQNDANQQLLQLQMQQQQQQLQYNQMLRDAGLQYGDLKRDTLNNAAARGLAYSSMYGKDVAENARQYNNYIGDLNSQNALFNQGIDLSRTQIQNGLSDLIRAASLQQAQNLESQAGNLGFGQSQIPVQPANKFHTSPKQGNKHHNSKHPRIQRMLNHGKDKSQIVAALTGSKDNSGNASKLSPQQLAAIGFNDKFIKKHTSNHKKKGKK